MHKQHVKLRLMFVPVGILFWVFGWCLTALGDKKTPKVIAPNPITRLQQLSM